FAEVDDQGFMNVGVDNVSINATAASQLLANSNFESGSLTGWTASTPQGSGSFFASTPGTPTPLSHHATAGNSSGGTTYAASDEPGPGAHILRQSFTVPVGTASTTLSYQMFVNDFGGGPTVNPAGLTLNAGPNQHARVDLLTSSASATSTAPADVIHNFYLGT